MSEIIDFINNLMIQAKEMTPAVVERMIVYQIHTWQFQQIVLVILWILSLALIVLTIIAFIKEWGDYELTYLYFLVSAIILLVTCSIWQIILIHERMLMEFDPLQFFIKRLTGV